MTPPKLTIVADAHIWGLESAFASLPGFDVELRIIESRQINHSALLNADVLITRSSTRVDRKLLEGTPIRFVATATIGDDHYDKAWLEQNGIAWGNAAGSSTVSVVEYMLTLLLELHGRSLFEMEQSTLGVVGAGRIGSALALRCQALGVKLLLNDPPRQRDGDSELLPLESLLESADIITLHTPLNRDGPDSTFHLIDESFLRRFKGHGIINAARGACIDNRALLEWLKEGSSRWAVLDCWENEPLVSRELLAHPQLVIATPHIAGHSLDGKAANTRFVYDKLCGFLSVSPTWREENDLPAAAVTRFDGCSGDSWRDLAALTQQLYPLLQDDAEMKSWLGLDDEGIKQAFSHYRRHYPVRRGWHVPQLSLAPACDKLKRLADKAGISLAGSADE